MITKKKLISNISKVEETNKTNEAQATNKINKTNETNKTNEENKKNINENQNSDFTIIKKTFKINNLTIKKDINLITKQDEPNKNEPKLSFGDRVVRFFACCTTESKADKEKLKERNRQNARQPPGRPEPKSKND